MMRPAQRWIRKMGHELQALACQSGLEDDEAYRALVLVARLQDARGSAVDTQAVQLTVAEAAFWSPLLGRCTFPVPEDVLEALAEHFEGPASHPDELTMLLLDVDDLCGVLGLAGDLERANRFAGRAFEIVSHSAPVVALGAFAEMRLETLRPAAAARQLWLPAHARPDRGVADGLGQDAVEDTAAEVIVVAFEVPVSLPLPVAAATELDQDGAVKDVGGAIRGEQYVEDGRRFHSYRLPAGVRPVPRAHLEVRDCDGGSLLHREDLPVTRDGRDLCVDLGPVAGAQSLAARIALQLGRGGEAFTVRIVVNG